MLSKCKKIAYSLALFGVKYISDLSSLSLNRNFVVSLEYKNSNRRKVLICKFHKNCLKWSAKRQIRSANRDSRIANSNPVITGRHFLYKFSVTQRFDAIVIMLRSLKQVFCNRSAFYVPYVHNNTPILLTPKV